MVRVRPWALYLKGPAQTDFAALSCERSFSSLLSIKTPQLKQADTLESNLLVVSSRRMMKIELSQTVTVLANLGVIGGLIFVGMQIEQDREISAVDRMQSFESNLYYWAELVNSDDDVWARGLSGEELSPNEGVRFNVLAEARMFALYSAWFTSERSVSFDDVTRDSFLQEAALEVSSNPGLLAWYRNHYDFQVQIGRTGDFDKFLNDAIARRLGSSGVD